MTVAGATFEPARWRLAPIAQSSTKVPRLLNDKAPIAALPPRRTAAQADDE